jgi:hypothetical protein
MDQPFTGREKHRDTDDEFPGQRRLISPWLDRFAAWPIFDSKQGIRGGNLLKLPIFRWFDFAYVKM